MEAQRDSIGALRERAHMDGADRTIEMGAHADPIIDDASQPGSEGMDIKDRAKQVAHGAMEIGSKAIHTVSDKIQQFPDSPESRGKGRMIAIGSMTAAGIGMAMKRRQQRHAKTRPQNIARRAKEMIPSR